jgi:hypothetical protein
MAIYYTDVIIFTLIAIVLLFAFGAVITGINLVSGIMGYGHPIAVELGLGFGAAGFVVMAALQLAYKAWRKR